MATMDTTNAGFGHGTASEPVVGRVLPTYLIGTACPTFCSDSHLASAGLTLPKAGALVFNGALGNFTVGVDGRPGTSWAGEHRPGTSRVMDQRPPLKLR
jgi:hypothetical protein